MEERLKKWEAAMQADKALLERLRRLGPDGTMAAKKGDLLSLKVAGRTPFVVSWNGEQIAVEKRAAKKPFLEWAISQKKFDEVFVNIDYYHYPPVLVAMNNDQKNITAGVDHHNGSLAVSFLVMLQECSEGGGK